MNTLDTSIITISLDELNKDLNIKLLEESDEIDGYETSFCKINISGKDVNYVIINTLRRVILSLIPVYGFDSENIKITKNTGVFNNDYMRLRLSNFPVYMTKEINGKYKKLKNLDHIQIINPEITLDTAADLEYRANLGTAEIDITQLDEGMKEDITDNLTIVVNVKNNSDNDIMNVMTNTPGVKFYFKKEPISHIYTNPLLIIQLQPGQEFACTMTSNLNNGMYHATFRPCSLCHYEEHNDLNYDFTIMSKRQISEKDIIIRACQIIKKKITNSEQTFINNIKKYNIKASLAKDILDEDDISTEHLRSGTIIIEGEQHTLGNLLSRYLQDHKDIKFAGYKVGHPNVNQVEIKYICNTDILNIINDVSKTLTQIFSDIENKVKKMNDFGYRYI